MLSERARRVHSLPLRKLIYLSVSHILVVSSIIALLSLNIANYLNYGFSSKLAITLWSLALLGGSYALYSAVKKDVDFLDYMGSLLFYHRLRYRSKELDMANTVLFFGLLLITLTPFLYTYLHTKGYSTVYAMASLTLGGVLVALAVSSYVLLEKMD